jgi:hypothetical protein
MPGTMHFDKLKVPNVIVRRDLFFRSPCLEIMTFDAREFSTYSFLEFSFMRHIFLFPSINVGLMVIL